MGMILSKNRKRRGLVTKGESGKGLVRRCRIKLQLKGDRNSSSAKTPIRRDLRDRINQTPMLQGWRMQLSVRSRPGHFVKDCPQSKEPVKGRVFAMTHDQIDPDSAIVLGMIRITDLPAFVLIDTGATHSFMSVSFMMKLRVLPDESISEFCVSLPPREELKSSSVVRNCKVQMQSLVLCADFIVLKMVDFDAIFGMDWLTRHEAIIDCKRKTVSVKDQNGKSLVFHTTSKKSTPGMISAGTTWQLLSNGCTRFLASLIGDQEVQRPKLGEVEVVKDFPEVFPDDVAGLAPVRKVEFGIELLPETKPAFKAPYKLAPTEMKELKDQLQ
ncbi:uncharacterized protein [Henckelia pumila]|uniref:uncharacterized protein n=1 Tax=Henckelia pumila TaxID=405737 RepID=UPI003C6E6592